MSVVNADITEIIQSYEKIKTAISSIEFTKSSINKKYQQLGNEWKDKKYKELGEILQECNAALNNIFKVLSGGEKYLSKLVKALQEYESVNLDGSMSADNPYIQSLRDMSNYTGSTGANQSWLGVNTNGTLPQGYYNILVNRYNSSDRNVRQVFNRFSSQLRIQDANYPPTQTAHYSPNSYTGHPRGVYYNASSDVNNPRGAGTTYFHELAHMIDHASTGYQYNLSNSQEFADALNHDGQTILRLYNSLTPERQHSFLTRIRSDRAHSFSDLIDATTNGQLHGSYGHSREYWERPGNLQAEAFAHFFEASMGDTEKLEMLSNFFPTAFGIFSSMIESILPVQRERVLER